MIVDALRVIERAFDTKKKSARRSIPTWSLRAPINSYMERDRSLMELVIRSIMS
jgi:hypothetical protein